MKTFPEVLTVRPILSAAGEVPMPGSKSISNRALLLAALSSGRTELKGILRADDTERMMESLRKLGVSVEIDEGNPESVTVEGCGGRFPVRSAELFLGNAGTAARPLTAALALAGCAAMNLCEEDKGYFVFTQNGGNVEVNVADDDSYGEYLNGDIYCLRKLPKGYYMNGWIDSPTVSKFEYINSSGEKICFRQSAPKGSTHIYTCEDGKPFEFGQFGGYDVICSKVSDGRTYLWFDGKYMMWLAVPDRLSETEVSRIIDGVGWRKR